MKIAVMGTGAMGSIYAVRLANAGHDVSAVDLWADHVSAINHNGLYVDGPDGQWRSSSIKAVGQLSKTGASDLYIISTKASGVASSARAIAPLLKPDGMVLTIQNGLGAAERIASYLPPEQVMLGVAEGFGASITKPGHVRHTSMKQIRLGMMKGGYDPRLDKIAEVWRSGGFHVEVYEDIARLIWEKLLCNVALSGPCTAFLCNVAELRANPERWQIALGCMKEAYAAGLALDIAFSFDDPLAYVTAFAERVGTARPSMLQDHEAGRLSELDVINGAIPALAGKTGIPTPYNDTICAVIRAREERF